MKLKLADWANIAEVLSGLAVVVTLILLVMGIRDNTAVARASVYDSAIGSLNDFRALIINDRDVAGLWQAIPNGKFEELDEIDQDRALQLGLTIFGIFEKNRFFDRV